LNLKIAICALAAFISSSAIAQDRTLPKFANISFLLNVKVTGDVAAITAKGVDVTCTIDTDDPDQDHVVTRTAIPAFEPSGPLPEGVFFNEPNLTFTMTVENFPIGQYLEARNSLQWMCTAHHQGKIDASHHDGTLGADGIFATLVTRRPVPPAASGTCDYALGRINAPPEWDRSEKISIETSWMQCAN